MQKIIKKECLVKHVWYLFKYWIYPTDLSKVSARYIIGMKDDNDIIYCGSTNDEYEIARKISVNDVTWIAVKCTDLPI